MKLLSQFESKGNIELLSQVKLAVFASKYTPLELYSLAIELFHSLCKLPISLCSGWQAPLEKELLANIKGSLTANIVYYSAKDIGQIHLPEHLESLYLNKKLLLLSAQSRTSRASKGDINKRDDLLLKQVDKILFMYIRDGGRLEEYYNQKLRSNFPVYILDHELNQSCMGPGSIALNSENVKDLLGI